ncbi:MAG: TIGR03016 family PEP-CTERM system-associated outer membrane protein, partial [Rhizomicrobium sp.]
MASSGASAQSVFTGILDRPPPGAAAPLIDTRDFSITPMVGLQETFTDNALLTSTNKQADFITRPMVGAEVNVHGPFTASFVGHAYYDAYINESQLSGFSGDAVGTANYAVIPDFLAIDAAGLLMNSSVSTFGSPALNRVGPGNQVQIATYDIGPHLTTTLDSFADLDVAGRFAQVFYDNPTGSTVGVPPSSSILAGAMAIDTAQRYQGYQLITNALIEQDNHNFQAYNFQQSVFVGIFPSFRVIGRGGYDDVEQPGIVNIR